MRVLHIITGLSTGGAERALYNLLSGGLADKCETAVLSLSGEGTFGVRIRDLGVSVHTLNMSGGLPTPLALKRFHHLVKVFRPELIQGWMYHGNLAASLAAWFAPDKPAAVWNVRHSLYSLAAEKTMTRWVIRANQFLSARADTILYNSQLSRQQHESFGFCSEKATVIANGFDARRLRPQPEIATAMRQSLAIPLDVPVVGHVARYHLMKDHIGFLRAAVDVLKIRPEVVFLLAGRGVNLDNPALSGIVPNELQSQFRFVGERDDVIDVMQAMDVLCMSSAWGEAFPNVLAEAMCLEIPCLATDVGDSREIIGTTGRIVPAGEQPALAQEMLSFLSMPIAARHELGKLARERIEANYALPDIVQQYHHLYRKLRDKND